MKIETGSADFTSTSSIVGVAGKRTLIVGAVVLLLAAVVPIDSAVIASGKLGTLGNNINISHPSGGRVVKVLARDGDAVRRGDPIIEIDPTINQAQLSELAVRSAAFNTERIKLEREIAALLGEELVGIGGNPIDWDLKTASLADPEKLRPVARDLAELQSGVLQSRLDGVNAERDIIESRIVAQRGRLEALRHQYQNLSGLRRELEARAESARALRQAGHMSPVEALDFEMQALDSISRIETLKSEVVAGEAALSEMQSQLKQLEASSIERTRTRLAEVIRDAASIEDNLQAAIVARDNAIVRAPADGVLTGSTAQSEGIVVPGTQPFAILVPSGQPLEFIARVRPQDITSVTVGREARLRISALNARQIDNVKALVTDVSADTKQDERTGESYFEARLRIDIDQDQAMLAQIGVGMTGDAFILGESRTFLSYVMQPIVDGFSSGLREVR